MIGYRWQRLSVNRQALLTLTHLRVRHLYAHLAAGFDIGATTAYRLSPRLSNSWQPSPPAWTTRCGPRR